MKRFFVALAMLQDPWRS
uniref:Uncharacterized protein n=1 Tax=Rhizophora mucronata TaxID=61149 RepID=A0A2P2PFB3_RHIMU